MSTNLAKPLRLRNDGGAQLQLERSGTARSLTVNASGNLELDGTFIPTALTTASATVTGGSINGTPIGGTTASTGAFTTVSASTSVTTPLVTRAGTLALSATGANVITASTNGEERLRITSAGNVGIGTSAPASKLSVVAAATDFGGGANGAQLTLGEASQSTGKQLLLGCNTTSNNGFVQSVHWGVGFTALLLQQAGGNVGIGTSSPNERLEVAGNIHVSGADRSIFNRSNNALTFGTNNTERMRITSAGNVGIGTSSPGSLLDVGNGSVRLQSNSTARSVYLRSRSVVGTTSQNVIVLTIPATGVFVLIKATFIHSRASVGSNIGTSRVGERYFCIARDGSGSDVVLDDDIGTQGWVENTTTAGGTLDASSGSASIPGISRTGTEANTDPQGVAITYRPVTSPSSNGAAVFFFEILYLSSQDITIN